MNLNYAYVPIYYKYVLDKIFSSAEMMYDDNNNDNTIVKVVS